MKNKRFILCITALLLAVLTSSCSTTLSTQPPSNNRGYGPPPHAPAHGYRRKLPSKVEVVFDSNCGVYVVIGLENHFWLNGNFYRFCNGQWEWSIALESDWTLLGEEKLPPGLRKKYTDKLLSKENPGIGRQRGKNK